MDDSLRFLKDRIINAVVSVISSYPGLASLNKMTIVLRDTDRDDLDIVISNDNIDDVKGVLTRAGFDD